MGPHKNSIGQRFQFFKQMRKRRPKVSRRDFFCEINKLILKFLWKCQELRIAKKNLEKRTKLEDTHFLISKFTTKLEQSKSVVLA